MAKRARRPIAHCKMVLPAKSDPPPAITLRVEKARRAPAYAMSVPDIAQRARRQIADSAP
eukprot:1168875-Rhodomonas_salina.3